MDLVWLTQFFSFPLLKFGAIPELLFEEAIFFQFFQKVYIKEKLSIPSLVN